MKDIEPKPRIGRRVPFRENITSSTEKGLDCDPSKPESCISISNSPIDAAATVETGGVSSFTLTATQSPETLIEKRDDIYQQEDSKQ